MAYQLKEWFIHTKHVSLVNIIAGREVVKELIAHLFTEANLEKELEQLLTEEGKREAVRQGYAEVRLALGSESAAENAARDIVHSMQKN